MSLRITAALALAFAAGQLGCSSRYSARDIPAWPEAGEVERITARLYDSLMYEPDTPEFDIPAEYIPAVLRAFDPPEISPYAEKSKTREVGTLLVVCKEGRQLDVRLRWFGKGRMTFALDGVPCGRAGAYVDPSGGWDKYVDEVLMFQAILRDMWKKDEASVKRCLEHLDHSAGRIPVLERKQR